MISTAAVAQDAIYPAPGTVFIYDITETIGNEDEGLMVNSWRESTKILLVENGVILHQRCREGRPSCNNFVSDGSAVKYLGSQENGAASSDTISSQDVAYLADVTTDDQPAFYPLEDGKRIAWVDPEYGFEVNLRMTCCEADESGDSRLWAFYLTRPSDEANGTEVIQFFDPDLGWYVGSRSLSAMPRFPKRVTIESLIEIERP
ncbi:hypothetical protein RC74_11175 [Falsihalocynthiibacter arcticus]|uniref:Uncharacterized protein n=2 Tax=Falsihalocynthiibacter arcticus TaxID=1579316 RepID=A0A126V0S1_9RHOB|nr:hypothetical protein RC74_11175 [Falsihalocynthiibacter arcticus]